MKGRKDTREMEGDSNGGERREGKGKGACEREDNSNTIQYELCTCTSMKWQI